MIEHNKSDLPHRDSGMVTLAQAIFFWASARWLCDGSSCLFSSVQYLKSEPDLLLNRIPDAPGDCFSVKFGENWNDHCFPSVIIGGFPKCGSSFVFKMLSSHPNIVPTKRKELCLGGVLSETWSKFFPFLPNMSSTEGKKVMSGCLHLGANIKSMKELCVQDLKLIYVLRDVADMLWSAYNFWCLDGHDPNCSPGKHTSKTASRSPEHFHRLVVAHQEMGGGIALTKTGNCYKEELQEATNLFGAANVLVLKSESMLTASEKRLAVHQIQSFLWRTESPAEAARVWLEEQSSFLYRVNSGHSVAGRGEKSVTIARMSAEDREAKGLYEVSGFQPMLPETRRLIHQRWRDECDWLRRRYSLHYEGAC
jgi:hypothetical protein